MEKKTLGIQQFCPHNLNNKNRHFIQCIGKGCIESQEAE